MKSQTEKNLLSAHRPGKVFFVIHGHFYQPPREEPWLEEILTQPGAAPYHDWNERIDDQCYAPNGNSRVLDGRGRVLDLVNNYTYLSFDFGPTLLSWLRRKSLASYEQVIRADYESAKLFGHGSALACAYNHMILPLANKRDRETQVSWGIKDFVFHFGRDPEGLWLPEAAVNYPTLEVLADHKIKFTVLSPYSARAVRPIGSKKWQEVKDGRLDITQPYRCHLPGQGKYVDIFFYDGPISSDLSFTNLMNDAGDLADRFKFSFPPVKGRDRVASIATDGETFGHHHPFADMCLAFLFAREGPKKNLHFVNFAQYLAEHEPTWEVQLAEAAEGTSWSCAHGVERWRADCGCSTYSQPGWDQKWRGPLRQALDWLRDELALIFGLEAVKYLHNPWLARNDYVEVINQRKPAVQEKFLQKHARRLLNVQEKVNVWKLLESERYAQLMYTSCGWFFAELSGIETVQDLKYAARALELAQEFTTKDLKKTFLTKLALAKSNLPQYGDGRGVWQKLVEPSQTGWANVACHGAILTLLEDFSAKQVYQFAITKNQETRQTKGANLLLAGQLSLQSLTTMEATQWVYLLLVPRNGQARCYLRQTADDKYFNKVESHLTALPDSSLKVLIGQIEKLLGTKYLTLADTFFEQYTGVVHALLKNRLGRLRQKIAQIYQVDKEILDYFIKIGWPLPEEMRTITQYVLNWRLDELLEGLGQAFEVENYCEVRQIVETARRLGVALELAKLARDFNRMILAQMDGFRKNPQHKDGVRLKLFIELGREMKLDLALTRIQNAFWKILRETYPAQFEQWTKDKKEAGRRRLLAVILELAEDLNFAVDKEKASLGK